VDSLTEPLACGLGPSGSLVALDLSPKSVEVARRRLARFACVHLLAADVLEVVPRGFIVPNHPNPRCTAWCQTHIGRRFCK
jgi:hypothetical protein